MSVIMNFILKKDLLYHYQTIKKLHAYQQHMERLTKQESPSH